MHRVLLISGEAALGEQVKRALESVATVMRADPMATNIVEAAKQFVPDAVIVDSDARTGAQTTYERLSTIRQWFDETPIVVVGNEMGAQLILTAMRAGAQDFVDRDASDRELKGVVLRHLGARAASGRPERGQMVCVMSPTPGDEARDLAVNIASSLAAARRGEGVILVDLSLPASDAGIALGLELPFRVGEAVKDIARLDRALLDGALARCPRSGLYVLPLSRYGDADGWAVDMQDLRALIQMLQSLYDVVVIDYGPFSRHEDLIGLPGSNAVFFLSCNQRFTSIKAAGELMRTVNAQRPSGIAPVLAVHEFAPALAPDFNDIKAALGPVHAVKLSARWAELADSVNRGVPLSLAGPSPYVDQLTGALAAMGLMPERGHAPVAEQPVRSWARKLMGIVP
jgi:pilus assembly protein CpaE